MNVDNDNPASSGDDATRKLMAHLQNEGVKPCEPVKPSNPTSNPVTPAAKKTVAKKAPAKKKPEAKKKVAKKTAAKKAPAKKAVKKKTVPISQKKKVAKKTTAKKVVKKTAAKKVETKPSPDVPTSKPKHEVLSRFGPDVEQVQFAPWSQLNEFPMFDVRVTDGNLGALQNQIEAAGGIHNPFRVVRIDPAGTLYIVDGYRRKRALRELAKKKSKAIDLKRIPYIVDLTITTKGKPTKEDLARVLLLKALNESKPLNPVELGTLYQRRMELIDCSSQDVARDLGIQPHAVSSAVALIGASPKVRGAVSRGDIPIDEAVTIVTESESKREQDDRFEALKDEGRAAEIENIQRTKLLVKSRRGRKRGQLSANQARAFIKQVAQAASNFIRSDSPAKDTNETWVELMDLLRKARNFNITKRL